MGFISVLFIESMKDVMLEYDLKVLIMTSGRFDGVGVYYMILKY